MSKSNDLVLGTLDLLILRTLALEPSHGWAIARRIQQVSREVLQVQQGSLYPALYRLEKRGWIKGGWRVSEGERPVKIYALSASGRKHLASEREQWQRLSAAVNLVMEAM
ncbi:MAG: PadR family transcriptional regulator [Terriglobales bacterium]